MHTFKIVWLIRKIFLHQLPKIEDNINNQIENKIVNMVDTFLDMAAEVLRQTDVVSSSCWCLLLVSFFHSIAQ